MQSEQSSDTDEPLRGLDRLLHEPLLHFLVIGIVIFLLFAALDDQSAVQPADQIVVGEDQAVRLAEQFAAV